MRSDLVYDALTTVRNRYLLCQVASKATRKFHRPATRIQDTTNDVLTRIASSERSQLIAQSQSAVAEQRRRAA
jgi:hypothetical protein